MFLAYKYDFVIAKLQLINIHIHTIKAKLFKYEFELGHVRNPSVTLNSFLEFVVEITVTFSG